MPRYDVRDRVFHQARDAGYRSRAAFKLSEILRRLPQVRPGARVVELGCWPGGWLQVLAEQVGREGEVLGVDTEEVDALPFPVTLLRLDIAKPEAADAIATELGGAADAVLSDASPKLSGVDDVDRAREEELWEAALAVAAKLLRPGGALVVKGFACPEADTFREKLREAYGSVSVVRPKATRATSKELYWVVGARSSAQKRRPKRNKRRGRRA